MEALLGYEVTAMSCGTSHIFAVTSDHDVFSWGRCNNGLLHCFMVLICYSPLVQCLSLLLSLVLKSFMVLICPVFVFVTVVGAEKLHGVDLLQSTSPVFVFVTVVGAEKLSVKRSVNS